MTPDQIQSARDYFKQMLNHELDACAERHKRNASRRLGLPADSRARSAEYAQLVLEEQARRAAAK